MDSITDDEKQKLDRSKKDDPPPYYVKDVASVLDGKTRAMLEEYTGLSSNELLDHIDKARNRAWDICPYASIGSLTWLNPYILLHEAHDLILGKVTKGATILDCGCFFSTDLRYLACKGAPTDKMYGFDLEPRFFDIGFDFYNDRDRWRGTFITANALQELDSSPLGSLRGQIDIIWSPKFLHIWDRPRQVEVAVRLVALLKPQPGSLFIGSQNGLPEPEELPMPITGRSFQGLGETIFMGNADSIKEIWSEVAERTRTKWKVESRLLDLRSIGMHKDDGSYAKKKMGYNLQWTATLLEPPTNASDR